MFQRKQVAIIKARMQESFDNLIQVVVGPRQTGKTTMLTQALQEVSLPAHFVSADDIIAPSEAWLRAEWAQARTLYQKNNAPVILVLDEIQKVPQWPSIVKGLWDQDRRENNIINVFLSGSSSLLLRKGLEDSLMGRFELIRSPHWSLNECSEAFGTSFDDFLYFGGFPASQKRRKDFQRWLEYMKAGIIEPTITKDVLEDEVVKKPALLRALFELGAQYSSQELSYNKIAGQLVQKGNITTIAHYLDLLDKANMLAGLQKYHPKVLVQKKSSPRFLVYDQSLMTALYARPQDFVLQDTELKGHLVETCVGAHLLSIATQHGYQLKWWREGTKEVDFVLYNSQKLFAIEVKSGRMKPLGGMQVFLETYPKAQRIIIGDGQYGAIGIEAFLRDEERFWE